MYRRGRFNAAQHIRFTQNNLHGNANGKSDEHSESVSWWNEIEQLRDAIGTTWIE